MNNPIISICIPTYNRAECLKQCLESIVVQFKNPFVRENIEVVISDNASTDNTEQLVSVFLKEFPNVFYYKNSENIGVDRNILNVVEKAKGDYIWFMGDDDALFPDAVEYMVEKLKLCKFNYCLINCHGYDKALLNPSVRYPNFILDVDLYFETLEEYVLNMNKKDLVGYFCGLSIQIFKRQLWQEQSNKEEFIGTNAIHLFVLLSVMKKQGFAIIAKPLVKTRAANIRWDVFPGLETLTKREQSTTRILIWILETYKIPYSKLVLKIEQNKSLFINWTIITLKRRLLRNQGSRDLLKKLLGKL